jgi:mRNA interferase MazF
MKHRIMRGEIYYADLNPVLGSEQGGIRPVIIIQNDTGNKYSPTVIVAALTCKNNGKPKLPVHCFIDKYGLKLPSVILLEQLRTIDKSRLRQYVGIVSSDVLDKINKALLISLDLR